MHKETSSQIEKKTAKLTPELRLLYASIIFFIFFCCITPLAATGISTQLPHKSTKNISFGKNTPISISFLDSCNRRVHASADDNGAITHIDVDGRCQRHVTISKQDQNGFTTLTNFEVPLIVQSMLNQAELQRQADEFNQNPNIP